MDAQLRLLSAERRSAAPRPGSPRPPAPTTAPAGPDRPEAPAAWRIDDSTRAVGRHGLALAREALRNARRPLPSRPELDHGPGHDVQGDEQHPTAA